MHTQDIPLSSNFCGPSGRKTGDLLDPPITRMDDRGGAAIVTMRHKKDALLQNRPLAGEARSGFPLWLPDVQPTVLLPPRLQYSARCNLYLCSEAIAIVGPALSSGGLEVACSIIINKMYSIC